MKKVIIFLGKKNRKYAGFYRLIEKRYDCQIYFCGYIKQRIKNQLVLSEGGELDQIKKYFADKKVIAVVNKQDVFEILHGKLVDYFKVLGPSYKAMRFFKDKVRLHKRMTANNLAFYRPRTLISDLDNLKNDLIQVQYPVVIKPFAGAKSRGVFKMINRDEFDEIYDQLKRHFDQEKSLALRESKYRKLLIEEYIKGKVISFECYVDELGKLNPIFYTDVVTAADLKLSHMQHIYRTTPSNKKEVVRKKVEFLLKRLIKISGLRSSCLHPEFFVVGRKVYLIEMNVRVGGYRNSLSELAYGLSLEKMAFRLALGEKVEADFKYIKSATVCEVWGEMSGIVNQLVLPKSRYIKKQIIRFKPGESYKAPADGNIPLASFFVESDENSLKISKNIRKKVKLGIGV